MIQSASVLDTRVTGGYNGQKNIGHGNKLRFSRAMNIYHGRIFNVN